MSLWSQRGWRVSLTAVSVALFGAALTQPAFFFGKSAASTGPALRVLLEGWRALPHGYIEWCANPALFCSWAAAVLRLPRISMATACASCALMLMFLLRRTVALPGASSTAAIVSHGTGYWLWLGSAVLMVVAGSRAVPR